MIGSNEYVAKALIIAVKLANTHDRAMSFFPNLSPNRTIVVRLSLFVSSSKSLILLITNKLFVNNPQAKALRIISGFSVNV